MTHLTGISFFLRTLGCQMNENDSERIAGLLVAAGARKTERVEDAQVVIVNTCAVRGKSEDKLFSFLGRLSPLKRERGLVIGVAGCVAQLYRETLLAKKPDVDFVVGPDNYHRLTEILSQRLGEKKVATAWSREWNEDARRSLLRESPVSAYVTIMEGCDHFCAYCVVPYARGREKYRPVGAILDEVRGLVPAGYKEIQLLGQNVNSYRDPETGTSFPELLEQADKIPGVEWIRFITSNPRNFGREIAETMAASRHVCRQLHLPLQSGSSSILKKMKRGYGREEYLEKIALLRALMPEICLSTDIIVGFPGETEDEFRETLSILEDVEFANIFSFRYSPRPQTQAARLKDDVPFEVKRRRLLEVQELQKSIQTRIHRSFIGRTIRVLCLGRSKKDSRAYSGRSEGYQVVNFSAQEDVVNRFVSVRITDVGPYSLRGKIEETGPSPA